MVKKCCVPFCRSNYSSKKNEGYISCFRFPKNEEMKLLWIKAIQRENFIPSVYSSVCAKHFVESDMNKYEKYLQPDGTIKPLPLRCPTLKEGAIPKLFPDSATYKLNRKRIASVNNDLKVDSKSSTYTDHQNVAVKEELIDMEETEIDYKYCEDSKNIDEKFGSLPCELKIKKEKLDDNEDMENVSKDNFFFIKSEVPEEVVVKEEDEYSLVEQLLELVNQTERVKEEPIDASDIIKEEKQF